MKRIVQFTLLMCCVSLSGGTLGFHPDKHEQHTQAAISLYLTCQQYFPERLPLQLGGQDGKQVLQANIGLDDFSLSRAWNWHFYDPAFNDKTGGSGYIENNAWGMKRALHPYFIAQSKMLADMASGKKSRNIALGQVMHLIQDMAVPAHVAPIYHVAWQADPFDGYQPSTPTVINISRIKCEQLLEVQNEDKDMDELAVSLLRQLAYRTRQAISEPNEKGRTWHDYWLIYPNQIAPLQPGFTRYGVCGEAGFGLESEAALLPHCQMTAKQYDAFYHARVIDSVETSLKLLFLMNTYQ